MTPLGLLAVLLVFGLVSLARVGSKVPTRKRQGWWIDLSFGLLAGASSAAFSIAGPPLLIYAAVRGWDPDELRINLQAVLLPLAVVTAGGHGVAGLWTPQVLMLAAAGLPVVVLGLVFGPRLRTRLASDRGGRLVYGFIAVLGVLELISSLP
jgi:uncharacterized membrane protein YfcA